MVKGKATSNIDVKKANRNRIYRLIASTGAVSKPEIAHRLGMSLPTVMQNIISLQEQGLVREDGILDSTGGRKAMAFSCDISARVAVGVEITRDRMEVAVVGLDGNIIKSATHKTAFATTDAYAAKLATLIDNMVDKAGIEPERILGVGISIPGILSSGGRVLTSDVLSLRDFETATLVRNVPYECLFCNDANAAGIAELWLAEPGDNFAYLALSNSVGGAILWGGELFPGDNVRSGEFGHITLERAGVRCYCGKKGCLDCYCSAQVLSRHTDGDLAAFFALLGKGEDRIVAAWQDYLDYLATGVNILNISLDCDVVIGGYVGTYMEPHIQELRDRVAELSIFDPVCDFVKVCRRRVNAHSVGGALLHIKRFISGV